jgi:phospholipid/cholesterol/gamma-HCH transport system ATP-binding protein
VAFGLKYLTDTKQNEYLDIVKKTLSLVGLKDCEYMKISELSGGMKKRVALARAIAFKPSYLLYDEPTTGLDPITTDMVIDMIKDMKAKLGITTVVVTHDVKLAFTVSDRIAFLNKGKFIEMGSKDEIKNSKNSMVKEFINNTQMA